MPRFSLPELPFSARWPAALTVFAVCLAAAWFALLEGRLKTLADLQDEENRLKTRFAQKATATASPEQLRRDLDTLRRSLDVLQQQLPAQADVPELLAALNRAAAGNGLRLDKLTPSEAAAQNGLTALPFEISLSGAYPNIAGFIRDTGALPRIIVLNRLNLRSNADGNLTFNATATTYTTEMPSENAADGGGKPKEEQP